MLPSTTEYTESILLGAFKSLQLEPVLEASNRPYCITGNFAITYKMRHPRSGKYKALKCYTRYQPNHHWRLREITKFFKDDCPGEISKPLYIEEELWVDSRHTAETQFPVLLMDWVGETTLGNYVRSLCLKQDMLHLRRLAGAFDAFACWLLEQPFAHGDLKCDNIMVAHNPLRLVLIDLDGMFLPGMQGSAAPETGSPGYRHPGRHPGCFDRWLDDFSLLLISATLHILLEKPDWYRQYSNGDNLLFTQADLLRPNASPLFSNALEHLKSDASRQRLELLADMLALQPGPVDGLSALLSQTNPSVFTPRIFSGRYDLTSAFHEGLAMVGRCLVENYRYRYGFVNEKGEECIPLRFTGAKHFSGGMAAVKSKGKWGFIDRAGRMVIEPQFQEARSFQNGFAQVRLEDKWGYIRPNGSLFLRCIYEDCKPFQGHFFEVQYRGQWVELGMKEGG